MKILIEDLVVIFPYTLVFNQQVEYMTYLKRALDSQGHALLQMPTGTGKTACLISLLTSYISNRTKYRKIIYCTRTVVEMQKTLKEIKILLKKRYQEDKETERKLLAVGLTAKRNLCVHKDMESWRKDGKIQVECKKRTAQWVRQKYKHNEGSEMLCQFYEGYRRAPSVLLPGEDSVYSIQTLQELGRMDFKCPYYIARDGIKNADIIVFNYLYLLDPKFAPNFIKELAKDTIVVFDQAHNIDDVCIESYTVKVNKRLINAAQKNLDSLKELIENTKKTSEIKYVQEFKNILDLMTKRKNKEIGSVAVYSKQKQTQLRETKTMIDPKDLIPNSIINTNRFLEALDDYIIFFKNRLKSKVLVFHNSNNFFDELWKESISEKEFHYFAHEKLEQTLRSLEIADTEAYRPLTTLTFFVFMISTNKFGFKVIYQPNPMDSTISDPLITLACLDSSIAMEKVWNSFPCVILTSGTISPLELYPKILGFKPLIMKSIDIEMVRNSIQPMIIGRTQDQTPLSSEYKSRSDKSVSRNFANILINLSDIVPDGILVFFPSYLYLEHILKEWYESKMIDEIIDRRYVFVEKKDPIQSLNNLIKYKEACDIGRGAIFLAIARGKVAEGIDFEEHYGRCVVMMGFPVQNSLDIILLERIKYMVQNQQIKDKNEFFEFDTMRQCAQCLGRVMRKKNDYGLMIFADQRFTKSGKYNKLPKWIKQCLDSNNVNLTLQMALSLACNFYREMGKKYVMQQRYFKRQQYFKDLIQKFLAEKLIITNKVEQDKNKLDQKNYKKEEQKLNKQ